MRGTKAPALLAIAALAVGACGSSKSSPATTAAATATTAAAGATTVAPATTAKAAATTAAAGGAKVTINYVLWDANQLPPYQECAKAFEAKNPNIHVEVKQQGWDDYWTGITTGFVSGTSPDVFTDHLNKYPEFAETGQILALDEFIARDKVDTSQYYKGLIDLWKRPDGKTFGLPKDWDTIAFAVDTDTLAAAKVDAASLSKLDWNPKDGGSFEKFIAKLSIDNNGKRGDEAGFDAKNVKTYGWGLPGTGAGQGQTEWSFLTGANGFTYMDKPAWGTKYNYNDPKFIETIAWIQGAINKGFITPYSVFSGKIGKFDLMKAGNIATTSMGSWEIGDALKTGKKVQFIPTPVGPTGKRASMFNGLADSIYAKTKHKEESWQWVKFLASADCENIVGDSAVVFPAIKSGADKAVAKRLKDGVDLSAFMVHVNEGTTFTFPIADKASEVEAVMKPAMEDIFSNGSDPAKVLPAANEKVNKVFS